MSSKPLFVHLGAFHEAEMGILTDRPEHPSSFSGMLTEGFIILE
jgi:hypothetical protein